MKIKTKFYKGEETNPFPPEMDEHYFWEQEKRVFGDVYDKDLPPEELKRFHNWCSPTSEWLCGIEEPPDNLKNVKNLDISLLAVFSRTYMGTQQRYGGENPATGKPLDYSKYSN